ncbi:TAXI family TRAP transporter solute-binding subunit [Natroniella sulfidigena]|uniref:TAXI family TRAP transporter solute-binding subunit n=1 Tax=Natroniella sulfidigena TaxID=723921 RepID=UPI00200B6F92|nr:TAXI family TRAP transporter solute-binding subunit [Natroniella sulfidigena]MCK8815803.1 TAXI family TRAP transporter solute-binding subunit [Natroniella sulfidigena]
MFKSKKAILGVITLLVVTIGLVGCGGEETAQTEYFSIGTGGTAGVYYPLGGAIANLIDDEVANVSTSAQSTGASVENIRLIDNQEVEIAIIQNDLASYAYDGVQQFDEPVENMRGIATLYPEVIQIVVRDEAGIEEISDLKGKSVAVGAPGSGVEANAKQILNTFGITYDDLDEDYLSFSEAAGRLSDRQIDAAFLTAGTPTAAVMDVAATQDIDLLNFSQEQIDELNSKYPYLTGVEVPAETYRGQDSEASTVALQATLIVQEDLEEDLVYDITEAIFENRDSLISAHDRAEEITVDTAQDGMTVPLHSGAERYFNEVE